MKFFFLALLLILGTAAADDTLLDRQLKCVKGLVKNSRLARNPRLVLAHKEINAHCTKIEEGKLSLDTACADAAWQAEPKRSDQMSQFYKGHVDLMKSCIKPKYQWGCLLKATATVRDSAKEHSEEDVISDFAEETIANCLKGVSGIGSCAVDIFNKEAGYYDQISQIASSVGGQISEKCTDPPKPIVAADGSLLDLQQKCVSGLIAETSVASNPRLVSSSSQIYAQCIKSEGDKQFLDTACADNAWSAEPKRTDQLANFYKGHVDLMQTCIKPKFQWGCLKKATVTVRDSANEHSDEEVISEFADESIDKCLHGVDFIGSCAVDIYKKESSSYEDISKVAAGIGGHITEKCSKDKFEEQKQVETPAKVEEPQETEEQCIRALIAKARVNISSNINDQIERIFSGCVKTGDHVDFECHNAGWDNEKKRSESLRDYLEGAKDPLRPCNVSAEEKQCVNGELDKLKANFAALNLEKTNARTLLRAIGEVKERCLPAGSENETLCGVEVIRQKVTFEKNVITIADRLKGRLEQCKKAN